MDKHKFRAWLPDENKMVQVTGIMWDHDDIIDYIYYFDIGIVNRYNNINNNIILMQCSNIKDSKGRLIWEGDIVYHWVNPCSTKVSEIYFIHGAFCYFDCAKFTPLEFWNVPKWRNDNEFDESECIVLGNRYQHKDKIIKDLEDKNIKPDFPLVLDNEYDKYK